MHSILTPARVISFSLFLITLAVNVSMPLFRPYAEAAGLTNGQTALVLAAYILGMLPCYVFLGGISDAVGRKPILILSLCCALAADLIITAFPTVYALVFARLFQGIALGLSMGTGTAYLAEVLHPHPQAASKAANAASLSTAFGFSGGAFLTTVALLIFFTFRPVTYYFVSALTLAGLLAAFTLPAIPPIGGKILRLPYFPKGSLPINLSIAICWATGGIVIAVLPSQLATFGYTAYAGFCLVLVNWTGAFLQPWIRKNFHPATSLRIGFWLMPLGMGLVVLGSYVTNIFVILAGTAIIGSAAYGFSYQGGLALISQAGGVQRSRAVAGYMCTGYIGFGIPAIGIGYLADYFGLVGGLLVFEIAVILLSLYLFFTFKQTSTTTVSSISNTISLDRGGN
ncbi:MFS transporter [Arundinibacter roseus]|uniref:MFS transporter n=1 Tax=Arundinibacter roseus TaxID=2070510 RepID=A0A4R4K0T5_9BACT|nr:MFS transporter [Arundinibacter roseus]TDB60798.1 MFS transporter [Arundinibacter roseus]